MAACGRRWGKTEAAAVDAATMALVRPGSVQMIVSPSYDQSRLIFDTVERLLASCAATNAMTKVVRTPYPKLTILGSVITARTADEDGRNLRGNSADRVIVDEAAYVRDSVIHEVISPMLADRRGRLVMISTPFGKNHFYQAFVRGQQGEGNCASYSFPSWSNPHISGEYIEEQRQVLTPRQFAVEYEAQFIDDQSAVFSCDEINAACARWEDRFGNPTVEQPAYECVVAGIDWARYSDYTALVAVGVDEAGCAVIGIDRFNRMNWEAQMDRAAGFLKRHRVTSALSDATSIGDPLMDRLRVVLRENHVDIAVEGCVFTSQSKRELIDHLAVQFAHGSLAIPSDERLLRELQFFEYTLTASGGVKLAARGTGHDDLVIALALACRQASRMGQPGKFITSGPRTGYAITW